jgi:hypothetical protein
MVREVSPTIIAPQRGAIFKGEDEKSLEGSGELDVGIDVYEYCSTSGVKPVYTFLFHREA